MNASQAVREGVRGEVRLKTYLKGSYIFIEFADNGHGIPQAKLDRIFDPFFTTKPVGKGTGLGLSIVYNIIKRHEGRIQVTSDVDKGTVFVIQLPFEKGPRRNTG